MLYRDGDAARTYAGRARIFPFPNPSSGAGAFTLGAAGRRAHLEGPDGAIDRRVCLPHSATAAFEAQYTPAYAVIIAALTEPMTSMTVHAPPTTPRGLGSPRPHLHRNLLHRAFKVRLRGIPPETRRVCMRARVRQRAPMHAGLCVQGCVSVCACASGCLCVCVGATIGRLGGWSDDAPLRSMRRRIRKGRRSRWRRRHCPWPSIPHPALHCHIYAGTCR